MATATTHRVDWKLIWAQRGFRFFFVAMFVSLFGSGMNFVGVSWYILAATHSTVKVSWQVIVVTLPGLFVPFLGGVLIDRFDRRYLGVVLDLVRGVFVLATAYIAWHGNLQLWHLYAMTLITGVGSAMYWATVNSLVQEVIPSSSACKAACSLPAHSSASSTTARESRVFSASTDSPTSSPRFAFTARAAVTSRRAII
jgi:MFS family permease